MPVGKRLLKPCGTRAAYDRHVSHGETPCDECVVARRAYNNEHGHDPDKKTVYDKSRYPGVRDKKIASALSWYASNKPVKQLYDKRRKAGDSGRGIRLKLTYGITLTDFKTMFELQGLRCACCSSNTPRGRNWCVDHDHATGQIRGILCTPCNTGIGGLGDTLEGVANGLAYLQRVYAASDEAVDEHY